MLVFKDGDMVRRYKVNLDDNTQASKLLSEMLDKCTVTTKTECGLIDTDYGRRNPDSGFANRNTLVKIYTRPFSYFESCSYPSCRGKIFTTKYVFHTPYTLALAAENFNFTKRAPIDQSGALRRLEASKDIAPVIGSCTSEELAILLSQFGNCYDALNQFLSEYYPDLYYLRKYLECIHLTECESYRENGYERDGINDEIKIATSNTEICKRLNLTFKGRNF